MHATRPNLDARTVLLLFHPDGERVLLLQRSPDKRLFPNLITGIGGAVELRAGEADDVVAAALRELEEETPIARSDVADVRLRLTTLQQRGGQVVLIFWLTGRLLRVPDDLHSPEGVLSFHPTTRLPTAEMVPTAALAIPHVLSLTDAADAAHDAPPRTGVFTAGPEGPLRLVLA